MSTYGIEITGSDGSGSYIVADTTKDLVNYAVVAVGTASSVDLTATQGKFPLLMINANQTGNTGKIITTTFAGFARAFRKLSFSFDSSLNISITSNQSATVDYILLKDMTGISNSSTAGDYGVQIFTAAGEVAVDSRRFLTDTTFNIKAAFPPGTVSGNNGTLSTDPDQYVDSSWFTLLNAGDGQAGTGALFNPGGGSAGIKHYSFLEDTGNSERGGTSTINSRFFSNFDTILIGE